MTRPGPILVVDDEPEVRETLQSALDQGGYDVVVARDAQVALGLMANRDFPIVVTDVYMPGLSGLDFLSEIRARFPETLSIVITGYASTETAVEALKRGAYDFIQKPFRMTQMEATLDRALEHARARSQLADYHHRLEELVLARTREIKALYDEVLELNGMLRSAQGEGDVDQRLQPFLSHLRRRFGTDEEAILLQEDGQWRVAAQGGPRTWELSELSARLSRLSSHLHLPSGLGSLEEAFLVPLYQGKNLLGALVVGFAVRSAFQPTDPHFGLWCRQVEAALNGWGHLRERPASPDAEVK